MLRDAWLAPLTMDPAVLSQDPQVHQDGVRASDKGYLNMSLDDYLKLLEWTATLGRDASVSSQVPEDLVELISRLQIEPSLCASWFGTSRTTSDTAAVLVRLKR